METIFADTGPIMAMIGVLVVVTFALNLYACLRERLAEEARKREIESAENENGQLEHYHSSGAETFVSGSHQEGRC